MEPATGSEGCSSDHAAPTQNKATQNTTVDTDCSSDHAAPTQNKATQNTTVDTDCSSDDTAPTQNKDGHNTTVDTDCSSDHNTQTQSKDGHNTSISTIVVTDCTSSGGESDSESDCVCKDQCTCDGAITVTDDSDGEVGNSLSLRHSATKASPGRKPTKNILVLEIGSDQSDAEVGDGSEDEGPTTTDVEQNSIEEVAIIGVKIRHPETSASSNRFVEKPGDTTTDCYIPFITDSLQDRTAELLATHNKEGIENKPITKSRTYPGVNFTKKSGDSVYSNRSNASISPGSSPEDKRKSTTFLAFARTPPKGMLCSPPPYCSSGDTTCKTEPSTQLDYKFDSHSRKLEAESTENTTDCTDNTTSTIEHKFDSIDIGRLSYEADRFSGPQSRYWDSAERRGYYTKESAGKCEQQPRGDWSRVAGDGYSYQNKSKRTYTAVENNFTEDCNTSRMGYPSGRIATGAAHNPPTTSGNRLVCNNIDAKATKRNASDYNRSHHTVANNKYGNRNSAYSNSSNRAWQDSNSYSLTEQTNIHSNNRGTTNSGQPPSDQTRAHFYDYTRAGADLYSASERVPKSYSRMKSDNACYSIGMSTF